MVQCPAFRHHWVYLATSRLPVSSPGPGLGSLRYCISAQQPWLLYFTRLAVACLYHGLYAAFCCRNMLVGLAAIFAQSGRTMVDKFIGLALPVTAFVILGVQHSPANMGYFSLALVHGK